MIEIGTYYRRRTTGKKDTREGRVPEGELVLVVDIEAERVRFTSGEDSWYQDAGEFERQYDAVPDGAREREREIAALLEGVRTEQAESVALSNALAAQPLLGPGPDAGQSLGITTEGAASVRLRVADVRNQVARMRQSLATRKARLRALLREQESAIEAQAKRLEGWLSAATEAIWAINLYLGKDETIVRLADGDPADPEEPIVVRQLVLYMDEETGIGADRGGLDAMNIDAFDAWVREPEHLRQVLPERRGVVAFKVRRNKLDYGDSHRTVQMAALNRHTYFLIRNGDRLFRIDTEIEVEGTLFPTTAEFDKLFVAREYDFDRREYRDRRLRPGSAEFMKAHDAAIGIERHYLRVALMLQGLLDRTTVFHPLADERVNILDPREHRDRVRFVHDAERTLGDGRPSFRHWLADINSRVDIGHRVVGAFSSHEANLWADYNRWRVQPRWAGAPSDTALHTIDRREGQYWVLLFDRSSADVASRRASFRLDHTDSFFINFDLATVDDCRRYLTDRVNRQHYLSMIPLLERVLELKNREFAEEAPFRQLLAGRIATRHEVAIADAEEAVDALVSWWKFKTRTHRALSSDDARALRMIVDEFGARRDQARELDVRVAAGAAIVGAVRRQFPAVLVVAHKRDADYVALVAANGEDVFVTEQTWGVDRRSGEPKLRSEKPWTVVDARSERWRILWSSERWAGWPRRLRAREHLTDPERETLLAWGLDRVPAVRDRFAEHRQRERPMHLLAAALGPKDHLKIWVWTRPAKVPRVALLSKSISIPEVRAVRVEWERTRTGLEFRMGYPSGAMQADQESLPWNRDVGERKTPGRPQPPDAWRLVWTDSGTIAALRIDVAWATKATKRSRELSTVVWHYDRQVELRMNADEVARAYKQFLAEFNAPDLWEGHKKTLPKSSVPYRDRLGRALRLLVERDEVVAGRTVAEVLKAAAVFGLEQLDDDRDRDDLPLDHRFEALQKEDEEEECEEDDESDIDSGE